MLPECFYEAFSGLPGRLHSREKDNSIIIKVNMFAVMEVDVQSLESSGTENLDLGFTSWFSCVVGLWQQKHIGSTYRNMFTHFGSDLYFE